MRGQRIHGRFFLQEYTPTAGKPAGRYDSGGVAAVENKFGKGRTLLIGTYPGAGYFLHHSPGTKALFAGLLDWAGIKQMARSSDPLVKARLHAAAGGTYLWVVNPTRTSRQAVITLSDRYGPFSKAKDLWQQKTPAATGRTIQAPLEDRNVAVIRLE